MSPPAVNAGALMCTIMCLTNHTFGSFVWCRTGVQSQNGALKQFVHLCAYPRIKYDREGCSNAKSPSEENQKGSGMVHIYVECA